MLLLGYYVPGFLMHKMFDYNINNNNRYFFIYKLTTSEISGSKLTYPRDVAEKDCGQYLKRWFKTGTDSLNREDFIK